MSRIARPRNTNRKIVYFYIISATSGVKLGFFKGAKKKEGEDNTKKQGFIVEKPPKYGAFYRKVGKMAKIVRPSDPPPNSPPPESLTDS